MRWLSRQGKKGATDCQATMLLVWASTTAPRTSSLTAFSKRQTRLKRFLRSSNEWLLRRSRAATAPSSPTGQQDQARHTPFQAALRKNKGSFSSSSSRSAALPSKTERRSTISSAKCFRSISQILLTSSETQKISSVSSKSN